MKTKKKTMMSGILVVIFILVGYLGAAVVENKNQPAKGDYVFRLEPLWHTDSAGDKPFANVVELPVADSGHVFCRDLKNKEYYAFDKNGKYIATFGTPGQGPGEVKDCGSGSIAAVGDKVLIEDVDRILYYTMDGQFIRSVLNNRNTRPAAVFLNENEFISAPTTITGIGDTMAKMQYVNLKTGEVKLITDFTIFKGGFIRDGNAQAVAVIPTITPVMVVGKLGNNLYFGMNDKYELFITDLNGKETGSFNLERKRNKVSVKDREDVMLKLGKGHAPDDLLKQLAQRLPEEETYFAGITSYNNMLYIYKSHFVRGNQQQIDIFSPEGKYLYRAFVKVKDGYSILAGPNFSNGHIYMALEDEDGEVTINKYKTVFPK
jgi:outer membrane protein assembly factor BamB